MWPTRVKRYYLAMPLPAQDPVASAASPDDVPIPPPFDVRELRQALGQFGTGVTVIATRSADGNLVGLTANSFGALSLTPPLITWALRTSSSSLAVFDVRAEALAARFWPGPLTLVLPLRAEAGLSPYVTAELSTVAIRLPAHPIARNLIAAFGGPLAAPSANPSGRVSPTRAASLG